MSIPIIGKRRIDLSVDRKEYDAFKAICSDRGISASKCIDTMIRKFNRMHVRELFHGKETEVETKAPADLGICSEGEAKVQGDNNPPEAII